MNNLKRPFTKDNFISSNFADPWPLDDNPSLFPIWKKLKHLVSWDNQITLPDLKDSNSQHGRNNYLSTLLSALTHVIFQIQILADDDGCLADHVLL